jgi:biotin carboxyl carrier protein
MAAPMSRAQRPGERILVVEPTVATRLPGDGPQRIGADAAVEWRAPGRAILLDGAGRSIPVLLGTDRQASPGAPRTIEVVAAGWRFELEVEDARRADLRRRAMRDRGSAIDAGGPLEIHAIIPGRVAAVAVATGDVVAAGHTLLVVEAMKMQNELRSPRDGTVQRVAVGVGETIDLGDLLVVLE